MGLFDLFSGKKKKRRHASHHSKVQRSQLVRSEASERAFVVLLVKMMNEDGNIDDNEYQQIIDSVMECVQLDSYSIRDLVDEALAEDGDSLSKLLSDFMHSSTEDDRESLVQQLWQVAMADGTLEPGEEALLRRVAASLHVRLIDMEDV